MINCIALDDEPLALDILQGLCNKTSFLKLQKTFTDPEEAARYLRKFPVDLIFLDIQMPDISGIDFYKINGDNKMVIFTTAFSNYAVEGFNLNAIDYLLKPITPSRFMQAATKAHEYHNYLHQSESVQPQYLFVRAEYSLVKIPLGDILYIETLDDYIKIHLEGRKPVITKMNLKSVSEKLGKDFVRPHRSYIIPMSRILSVRSKTIYLQDLEIPIGIKFEDAFFARYKS